MNEAKRSKLIAAQNDRFRKGDQTVPGTVVVTQGIDALDDAVKATIFAAVRNANAFDAGNDPYGEHDFGSLDIEDVGSVLWKIDYYDSSLSAGSEDPSNLEITKRVLTIMLASEY